MKKIILLLFINLFIFWMNVSFAAPIVQGNAQYTVTLNGLSFKIFTYKPKCDIKSILFVFHGNARNAKSYRDATQYLADRLCMIIVAPLFDAQRFPGWRYQRGGIVHRGIIQKPGTSTSEFVIALIHWTQDQENRTLPYAMMGHSAGAQFLSRLAAYTPTNATRIVIANPSTYVFANLDVKAPYGFGGIYSTKTAMSQLKRYLATPITIFLGEKDITNKYINNSSAALAQGNKRFDRGLNAYYTAQRLAKKQGWAFNWRLIEVPNVGHNMKKMFSSTETIEALSPH